MGLKASGKDLPWDVLNLYDSTKESSPIVNWNLVVIDLVIGLKKRGWFIHQKKKFFFWPEKEIPEL